MSRPTCAGCGAIIRWVRTPQGKAMPVDPEKLTEWLVAPDERDDTIMSHRALGPKLTLVTAEGETVTGWQGSATTKFSRSVEGYVSHFATCPKAAAFRRKTPR